MIYTDNNVNKVLREQRERRKRGHSRIGELTKSMPKEKTFERRYSMQGSLSWVKGVSSSTGDNVSRYTEA